MSQPFLGQIQTFGFNFAPRGWAFCNGQILPIAQNTALFALLGTTYGGNGQTTFALPNLQSRVPIHFGQGPGLSSYALGQASGTETVTLLVTQMPAHNHLVNCTDTLANQSGPANHIHAQESQGATQTYSDASPDRQMNPISISPSGGNQPHDNIQPYLAINFCIALEGIFPSRN